MIKVINMAFTFFKIKQEKAIHCSYLKIPAKTYCAIFKLKKSQENVCMYVVFQKTAQVTAII